MTNQLKYLNVQQYIGTFGAKVPPVSWAGHIGQVLRLASSRLGQGRRRIPRPTERDDAQDNDESEEEEASENLPEEDVGDELEPWVQWI